MLCDLQRLRVCATITLPSCPCQDVFLSVPFGRMDVMGDAFVAVVSCGPLPEERQCPCTSLGRGRLFCRHPLSRGTCRYGFASTVHGAY